MAKNIKLYETITHLEGAIKFLRNEKIYSASPQEVTDAVNILEAEKARLEEKIGA